MNPCAVDHHEFFCSVFGWLTRIPSKDMFDNLQQSDCLKLQMTEAAFGQERSFTGYQIHVFRCQDTLRFRPQAAPLVSNSLTQMMVRVEPEQLETENGCPMWRMW